MRYSIAILLLAGAIFLQQLTIKNMAKDIIQLQANQVKLYNIECKEINIMHSHFGGSKCEEL